MNYGEAGAYFAAHREELGLSQNEDAYTAAYNVKQGTWKIVDGKVVKPQAIKSAAETKAPTKSKTTSYPEFNGQRESGTYTYNGTRVKVTVKDTSTPGERNVVTTWDVGRGRDLHIVQYDFGSWGGKSRYEVRGKNRNGGYYQDFGNIYSAIEYVKKHKYSDFFK